MKILKMLFSRVLLLSEIETVRSLRKSGQEDALREFENCLNGESLISLDTMDIGKFERRAKKEGRKIEIGRIEAKTVDQCKERLPELLEPYEDRDCVLMISGNISIEYFGEIIKNIDFSASSGNFLFGVNYKQNQRKIAMTCIAY